MLLECLLFFLFVGEEEQGGGSQGPCLLMARGAQNRGFQYLKNPHFHYGSWQILDPLLGLHEALEGPLNGQQNGWGSQLLVREGNKGQRAGRARSRKVPARSRRVLLFLGKIVQVAPGTGPEGGAPVPPSPQTKMPSTVRTLGVHMSGLTQALQAPSAHAKGQRRSRQFRV